MQLSLDRRIIVRFTLAEQSRYYFGKRKEMLRHSYKVLSKHYIRIDKQFDRLLTGPRTARATANNQDYDKEGSSETDLVDSFLMLSLLMREKE